MDEFSAREYVEICYQCGMLLGKIRGSEPDPKFLNNAINRLLGDAQRLGLAVTRDAIGKMVVEFFERDPSKASLEGGVLKIRDAALVPDRVAYHIECVYSTLKSELGGVLFRAVPRAKAQYCDPKWLTDTPLFAAFPSAWQEFQSAGRCYAYGENTACAFHLQRVLEWGLKSFAVHLGKRFDRNSWERHLDDIEKELSSRYGSAGPRTEEEKFYSEASAQFKNMKVAWRNPTMHIEAKYDEEEAAYLLTAIEKFMLHLTDKGLKEPA